MIKRIIKSLGWNGNCEYGIDQYRFVYYRFSDKEQWKLAS